MSTVEQADVRTSDVTDDHLSLDSVFDPDAYFGAWLAAIEAVRNREPEEPSAGVLLIGNDLDFEGVVSFDDQLAEKLEAPGTLVVAQHGSFQGDVDVTLALINGVFKGNITATEGVVIENHAVVIGDIYTPTLTIRGGAIIDGNCHFEAPKDRWGPPVWSALKGSLARVWRGRIFQ